MCFLSLFLILHGTWGKKGSKLTTQVPISKFMLEAFGNTHTLFNPNTSRFGEHTELQLTGIKLLDYYLKQNCVAGALSGECNIHILYYLVAGALPEE
jgi:chitin synthase